MVTTIKKLIISGGAAISLVGCGAFAGVASAAPDETCVGGVPNAKSHQPTFPSDRVPGRQDADCEYLHDTSDNSMADIGTVGTWGETKITGAGSWPANSATMTAKPQSTT